MRAEHRLELILADTAERGPATVRLLLQHTPKTTVQHPQGIPLSPPLIFIRIMTIFQNLVLATTEDLLRGLLAKEQNQN